MPYYLKIISAPEKADLGRKLELAEGENLVGRVAPPCRIKLDGKKVSKQHCAFRVAGRSLRVEDLKSSNGLFVNGRPATESELRARDRIVVGDFTLEVAEG